MQCENILIVEDHDDVRDAIEQALKMEGYRAYAVRDGKEALAALKRIEGQTLILLDMMMPAMSGWDFIQFQQRDQRISENPVVVVSALNASNALNPRQQPIPAVGYIRKPLKLETLLETVRQYCGKGQDERAMESLSDEIISPQNPG